MHDQTTVQILSYYANQGPALVCNSMDAAYKLLQETGNIKKTLNKERTAKHLVLHFNDFHHTLINLASLSSNHFLSLLRIRVEEACIYFTVQTIISL